LPGVYSEPNAGSDLDIPLQNPRKRPAAIHHNGQKIGFLRQFADGIFCLVADRWWSAKSMTASACILFDIMARRGFSAGNKPLLLIPAPLAILRKLSSIMSGCRKQCDRATVKPGWDVAKYLPAATNAR